MDSDWDMDSDSDMNWPVEQPCNDPDMPRKLEELARLEKKQDAEMELRKTAKAIEEGFSCWEEYTDFSRKRSRSIRAGFLERLAELGTTEEKWYRNDPQRWTPKICHYALPVAPLNQCDCLDHPIPSFCPQNLVELRSMEEPDRIEAQGNMQRELIEGISLEPSDVSKRMPQEILEQYWDIKSQEIPLKLAPWFKGDETLRRIVDVNLRSRETSRDKPALRSKYTRKTLRKGRRGISLQTSEPNNASKPKKPKALCAHETRPLKKARIQKSASQPSLRTRSRNITKFYELNSSGMAVSYQKFDKSR